jgi:tetratricopeptide (TPR) repeat protein
MQGRAVAGLHPFRLLSLLVLCLQAPRLSSSTDAARQGSAAVADQALHELFPRVPLARWAHIQRSFEDEDAPFNSRSEGYREVAEMLSDASEVGATPGREADGLAILRDMVQRWPQHQSSTKVYLAFHLMFDGRPESLAEAQQLLEEALAAWNRNLMAHNNLGVVLEAQGKHDEALQAYAIGIEAANVACFILHECATAGAPIFANLGRALRRAGNWADAVRAYETASRLALGECGGRNRANTTCTSAASRYYLCLALQLRAEEAAARGDGDGAQRLLSQSRAWLLRSMLEPAFRYDPVLQLLQPDDAEWLRRRRFSTIFATRFWHPTAESRSGPGSGSDEITEGTRAVLDKVLRGLHVQSMLDIGCGDWNWMKLLNLSGTLCVRCSLYGTVGLCVTVYV